MAGSGFGKKSKGQVSTELLIVVATVLVLFIPLIFVIYIQSSAYSGKLDGYKTELAIVRLTSLINSVGNMGGGSYVLAEIYLPDGVNVDHVADPGPQAKGSEIIFKSVTADGASEIVRPVEFKVDGLPQMKGPGYFRLEITNYDGRVKITQPD